MRKASDIMPCDIRKMEKSRLRNGAKRQLIFSKISSLPFSLNASFLLVISHVKVSGPTLQEINPAMSALN